jgi:transcriptional regulator with XRE-family HTH domain
MNSEINKQIMAKNIKRYMDQRGITRYQLCDALDIKYTTLRDWLKGLTYPRIGKVEAMANYFGCEKSDLIEEKTIDSNPVEMAERHFEMVMDEDLSELFDDFRLLDAREKKIVKDLAHSLAETKMEA